jgi:transcriptional regulator with XRE-family HTH domain
MTDPRSFGAWLQRERERRSITLRAIADRTKIGVGLLQALERGDISRWPGGIYRRAFVRAYAGAVGLDGDLVVANFERVFPSDPSATIARAAAAPRVEQQEMRLALVTPPVAGAVASAMKTAARDLACVLGGALVGFAAAGAVGFWFAAAVVAIAFHTSRVFGLQYKALWHRIAGERHGAATTRAEVVSFTEEHSRSMSRRARARRVLADLSAAASSAATAGRRRAARL